MELGYKASFVRQLKTLPCALQAEALVRIKEFKNPKNHARLHVHPLKGKLRGFFSFSVNYRYRIVFQWIGKGKNLAALTGIGDHDIYQ